MNGLTAVSLFAGIGGFDEALRRAGVHVAAAVEIDADCRSILARHFPETHLFSDVKEVTGDQLRAAGLVPGRGIVTAGWPCQGNSVAGRRKGMADPRSGLWRQVVRLLDEARPRWFIGENVPGLLSISGGRDFGTVLRDLDDLGYGVAWRVLDAQWFGVPQRRRRLFVAGCLGDPAAAAEILLEPEGGDGNPATRGTARTLAAAGAGGGADCAGGGGISHTITAREAKGPDSDSTSGFVFAPLQAGIGADEAAAGQLVATTAATLQGGGRRGHRIDAEGAAGGHLVPVALRGREGGGAAECGGPGDPAFTVRTAGGGSSYPMVAHALTSEGADASEDGTGRGTPLVTVAASLTAGTARGEGVRPPGRRKEDDVNLVTAVGVSENQRGELVETPVSHQLTTGGGKPGQGYPAVRQDAAVRRLTPRECERLQGFPDDWTRWQANGTEQSDSARYRQLGNAVAVPCAEWIARRTVVVGAAPEQAEGGEAA